jgi:hypothetical protein
MAGQELNTGVVNLVDGCFDASLGGKRAPSWGGNLPKVQLSQANILFSPFCRVLRNWQAGVKQR